MRMRGEYKTPGGKLVGVDVDVDQAGNPLSCKIDGDFFVMGDDGDAQSLISDIEQALIDGRPLDVVFSSHPSLELVGVDGDAIQTAYLRALENGKKGSSSENGRSICANDNGLGVSDKLTSNNDAFHQLCQKRWKAMRPVAVRDIAREPAEQMALDERWAREVAGGRRPATVRFWRWSRPAVVVGRFQSVDHEVDADQARKEGFDVVRRTTGGGTMFIEPDDVITYSLYAPQDFVKGLSVDQSFRLCDFWIIDALNELGIAARFGGTNDIVCADGKIGGAAQRLFPARDGGPGALLHHATIAYGIDVERMGRILKTSPEKMRDKAVKSSVKRVAPLKRQTRMGFEAVSSHLETYIERRYN
ncbi:lipoate--protein ligase family protein [Bifidobacterium sp. ESL0775]|uniref:lipoate--protein ligase family protein n=1 Tax=Bifidobacterium sp. ESL0775 TaxID=2983230 RepID=UPI0023F80A33|nr:lipoate--protein ligase family protein [Bifidobacterium sp. ESL0775]WEV69094.1 lipoate--protein ligase family protein [Bifidobacterium sp. ESL0775]